MSFNECLPLSDERAELVSGEVHTVEVGVAVFALDILADKLELPESVLVVVQISEGTLVHSSLQGISSDLHTGGSGHQGLADISHTEHAWCFDIVPFFLCEWIDELLLVSLPFGQALVLADSHAILGLRYIRLVK